jgi:hypothetical protein
MDDHSALLVAAARRDLESLAERVTAGDPYETVPRAWIDEFHRLLAVIASPESQRWHRLDGLYGVHRRHLHDHVRQVIKEFDRKGTEHTQEQESSD